MRPHWRERFKQWLCRWFGHSRKSTGKPWDFNGQTHRHCARCRFIVSVPIKKVLCQRCKRTSGTCTCEMNRLLESLGDD